MRSEVTISNTSLNNKDSKLVPVSPLGAMLVVPFPRYQQQRRSFWKSFLNDQSYLMPIYGIALGILMIFGQAPITGTIVCATSMLMLLFRLFKTYINYIERKRVKEFEKLYNDYLDEILNRKRLNS